MTFNSNTSSAPIGITENGDFVFSTGTYYASGGGFWVGTSDRTNGNNVIWSGSPYVIEDIVAKTESPKKTRPKKVKKTNSGLRAPTDMERRRIIDV